MAEREPPSHPLDPNIPEPLILTAKDWDLLKYLLCADELELVRRAEQGEVSCPDCTQPVTWVMMICEDYEGITLVCLACGYLEY